MSELLRALKAEVLKNKYSTILWLTFIAFSIAPIMGGVFMLIMRSPDALANANALSTKAQVLNFSVNWKSYLEILTQAIGVGGVLIFGFVASWIFGREYSDGTAKDLLSLPTSRTKILNAKFIIYVIWCVVLAVSNLFIGLLIGSILQLSGLEINLVTTQLKNYLITTVMTVLIGTPIAFFALWGKGYLAPLGFVTLTLVVAQIIAATGYGNYFPWALPGLFSGTGGEPNAQLDRISYLILILTSMIGYFTTIIFWKRADQTK